MKADIERKKRYNAPLHRRKKHLRVHVSKSLKEKGKIGKRSVTVKKGDKVKVMRGKHKGKEAKVARVSHSYRKVYLEGISVRTARGREMAVAFQPSNIQITELTERKNINKGESDGKKRSK